MYSASRVFDTIASRIEAKYVVTAGPGTLKALKKKFPDDAARIDEIAAKDPSGSKYAYLEWMWKQIRDGDKQGKPVDVEYMAELLERFSIVEKNSDVKFSAKNIRDLEYQIDRNYDILEEHYKKLDHQESKKNPPKILYDEDGFKAIEFFTHEQVCEFGKNTNWCVSQPGTNYYEEYDTPGTQFIGVVLPDGSRRMAMIKDGSIDQLRDEKQNAGGGGDSGQDVADWDLSRKVLDEIGFDGCFSEDDYEKHKIREILETDRYFLGRLPTMKLEDLIRQHGVGFDKWSSWYMAHPSLHKHRVYPVKIFDDAAVMGKLIPKVKTEAIELFKKYKKVEDEITEEQKAKGTYTEENYNRRYGRLNWIYNALKTLVKSTTIDEFMYEWHRLDRDALVSSHFLYETLDLVMDVATDHITYVEGQG